MEGGRERYCDTSAPFCMERAVMYPCRYFPTKSMIPQVKVKWPIGKRVEIRIFSRCRCILYRQCGSSRQTGEGNTSIKLFTRFACSHRGERRELRMRYQLHLQARREEKVKENEREDCIRRIVTNTFTSA